MTTITPVYYYGTTQQALAPLSAGTENNVCILDCSGNTISVVPPHPVWTNTTGKAVVLLDAIALGGINGLNS